MKLYCSFQDEDYLYLVMEYLPGGDIMNFLMREDTITETIARFYIAECVLAIESIHEHNYIHRFSDQVFLCLLVRCHSSHSPHFAAGILSLTICCWIKMGI